MASGGNHNLFGLVGIRTLTVFVESVLRSKHSKPVVWFGLSAQEYPSGRERNLLQLHSKLSLAYQ
jgi:hypothetical protein